MQRAISEAFDRVVEIALSRKVDFVLIAGDSFDTSQASYGDYLHYFDGLKKLGEAGIPVYLTTGNHDPYTSWQKDIARLPGSSRMLGVDGPEFALYEKDGEPLCIIGARGYRNQAWPVDEPMAAGITRQEAIAALASSNPGAARAPFCIGMIHTGLDIDQAKAYSDPQALLAADVDYWACGHLHKRLVKPSEDDPRIVFPGCIQGRDLKESGERGCYVVSMRESEAGRAETEIEFVPTANVAFQTIQVDVGACQTLADVAHLAQAQLFHENAEVNCDEMVVRIVLKGTTDLHGFLSRQEVLGDLRQRISAAYPAFYCDALVDRTRAPRNRAAMMREGLFEAHALRVADEQSSAPDEMVNYVQTEFVKRGIDVPSSLSRRIDAFNDAAETIVLDLLEGEEE